MSEKMEICVVIAAVLLVATVVFWNMRENYNYTPSECDALSVQVSNAYGAAQTACFQPNYVQNPAACKAASLNYNDLYATQQDQCEPMPFNNPDVYF